MCCGPRGNLTAAFESNQASLAIAERLARADPGNAELFQHGWPSITPNLHRWAAMGHARRMRRIQAIATGRINLIGEHTDYHDGFVLPASIDRSVTVEAAPREDNRVVIESATFTARQEFSLSPRFRLEIANPSLIMTPPMR